jgi:hypothetical protein
MLGRCERNFCKPSGICDIEHGDLMGFNGDKKWDLMGFSRI